MSVIKIPLGISCNYVSFNGELNINFKTPTLKGTLPYKCEMVHIIKVTQTDITGGILPGSRFYITSVDGSYLTNAMPIPYLNKNPDTTFYTSTNAQLEVKI